MAAPAHLQWAHHPNNPYNWLPRKKWTCMLTSCWVTFIVGLNATSITTAAEPISRDFNLSNGFFEYNFFAVTAWNAAAAIVPLATLPLMETYGMRLGFVTSYILFAIFIIPQALARNFATLVVCRAIAGAFGGTLQNSADGLASNIFLTHRERVFPLTLYVFALVFGVTMGPVLGAAFQPLGWRWVFWIEFIIYGACAPVVVIFMKESRGPILRARLFPEADTTKPTKHEAMRTFKETIVRSALLLTTEPTVTAFTLWSAFAFGLVFISTQSIPIVFSGTYNWPSYTDGLVQSSIGIGQIVGLLLTTFYQNRLYTHSAGHNPEHLGTPIPEAILHLSIPSTAVALAGGLFMYGWSTEQTHWIVPAVALALVGYAIMVIVTAASIYVTDSYAGYAASAIGAVAFGENIFAAFLPLAAKPMYLRLGYQWASSLLGFVAAVLALAPVVLIWKGRAIRERSVAIRRMNIEGL